MLPALKPCDKGEYHVSNEVIVDQRLLGYACHNHSSIVTAVTLLARKCSLIPAKAVEGNQTMQKAETLVFTE